MKKKLVALCASAVFAVAMPSWAESAQSRLSLGDPAPQIDATFVKGSPVLISGGDHVYIIEFWATWCGPCRVSVPHLTELQEKHEKQGLVVVGISDEDPNAVMPFVKEMGDKMNYRVAIDNGQSTAYRYMAPFGAESIPHAFVVDKSGSLIWHGHPLDSSMERLVASLLKEKKEESPALPSEPFSQGSSAKPMVSRTLGGSGGSGSK